jgi:APA family basic amino acid/polyamine antiporter
MSFAMVIGTIVGSGIYVLPATTAPYGINLVVAFIVTGLGTLMLALAMGKLAAHRPGGPYSYIAEAFGDHAAFFTMWCALLSQVTAVAAVAVAVGGALGHVVPQMGRGAGLIAVAFAAIGVLTGVQWTGARSAGRLQIAATLIKVVPLLLVALLVLLRLGTGGSLAPLAPTPLTLGGIAAAGALMLFAFTGFEAGPITANVTDKAEQAVPAATIRGTALTAILYLVATLSVLWLLPSATAAQSTAPFADAIAPTMGPAAGALVAVIAAISAFGTGNALILVAVEVMRAIANAGDMPPAFARTNANGVATSSLIAVALVSLLLVLASVSDSFIDAFNFISLVSAVDALLLYLVCAAAAWRLGAVPALIGVVGILYALAMFVGSGLEPTLYALALGLIGLPIRWYSRKRWSNRVAVPSQA